MRQSTELQSMSEVHPIFLKAKKLAHPGTFYSQMLYAYMPLKSLI